MTSPLNMLFSPFQRGLNKGRFRGEMNCPYCSKHVDPTTTPIGFESDKPKIRLKGNIGPFMREYKCMLCGGEWKYDIQKQQVHPYDSFGRGLKNKNINLPGLKHSGRVPLLGR